MTLKSTVSVIKLQPQALLAMFIADQVWRSIGAELVITAGDDSEHMPGSLHYLGLAFDCRTNNLRSIDIPVVLAGLRSKLTLQYDVVDETNKPGAPHIHIEFDPKKPPSIA